MNHQRPVCGFEQMPFPAEDHNICSCCGTEFGYHDLRLSHAELRCLWQAKGARWLSKRVPQPEGWNAQNQLDKLQKTPSAVG